MQHQKSAAVCHGVDGFIAYFDVAKREAEKLTQDFVVVARDIRYLGAPARFAQYFLDHVIVSLGPIPAALELPAIDDVADEIQVVGIVVPEEIEQIFGLATRCSQVDVGDPDRAIPVRAGIGRDAGSQDVGRAAMMARIKSLQCYKGIASAVENAL